MLTLTSLLLIGGCQKDEVGDPAGTTARPVNVTPRVQAFIANALHNSSSRDLGLITADSAEWYIEASLNYSFTDPSQNYPDQAVDTVAISIPLVGGEAQEIQAGDAYEALGQTIAASNVDGTSHVLLVDVVTQTTASTMDISAVYFVGSGDDRGVPNTNYGPSDNWWWMNIQGATNCGCDDTPSGSCADVQIQTRINYAINNGAYHYWTNVEMWNVEFFMNDDPANHIVGLLDHPSPIGPENPVANDGERDYPVYIHNGDGCLDPTDMSFFTQGTWDLMQMIRTSYIPSKSAAACSVHGEMTLGGNTRFHEVKYYYGQWAQNS